MEAEGAESSLDLSHLTEEEQSSILQVLMRDMDLQRCDQRRVRALQQTRTDPGLLRTLSGAWFSEASGRRHRGRVSGSDLVHATIRRRTPKCRDASVADMFNGGREGEEPTRSPSLQTDGHLKESTEENVKSCESPPSGESPPTKEACKRASVSMCSILNDSQLASLKGTHFHSSYTLSGGVSLSSSGVFGVVEVQGRIQFSLAYDDHKEELKVKVHRCEDVASVGDNRADSYVKSYLRPDMSSRSKRKTTVKRRTQNPIFEQTLKYKLRLSELTSRILNLSVWHAETLGKNVFLGEVEVELDFWDWTSTEPLWQDLQPRFFLRPECVSSRGSLLLSIKFIPEGFQGGLPLTGELHIWLQEGRGLLSKKGGAVDSFVRSYILPDAGCQSGQKTQVVKRAINPAYNHTMVYDGFQTSDLQEACAELTVWQREGLKFQMVGGIRLSNGTGQSYGESVHWMDSTEEEASVWSSMIKNPNHWVETALPIRTNLARRSSD
ncbi:synaptotagmin-like protein 1 isoform X1 [Nerophis ophidion]|uniref:synaptotagmin-like protein 1 isoform X1 n=2 Tax=Nerophis ophidion TaxID=159077 RepID=UPI002AE026CC|nr:synaptotagmin-like protein 1 isoform X1 [Nerophis ophidion]XP_061753062.1 synaptotagmin-like protein 1 isoform X1 [Nerophis ophidion]